MNRRVKWAMFLALCGVVGAVRGGDESLEGKIYFTTVNIWHEKTDAIPSTNYHSGEILPAGTKATIVEFGKDKIKFSVDGKGAFVITHMRKHNPMELKELFDQYFTDRDPLGPDAKFHTFTKEEQKHIADGTLGIGMSKDAVLMAYGYPPGHKTPKLEDNTWTYWLNKYRSQEVVFDKDGKVKSL